MYIYGSSISITVLLLLLFLYYIPTSGSQLKTMHNMRLLCCDVLDLCKHSTTFTGYVRMHFSWLKNN